MTIHSSFLIWKFPWTVEPGCLQSIGSQIAGHDWNCLTHTHIYIMLVSYLTSYFLSHSYTLPQTYCSRLHNAPPAPARPCQRSSCFNSLNLWIFPSYAVKLRICDMWGLFWIITWAQGSLLEEGNRSESEKTMWQWKQSQWRSQNIIRFLSWGWKERP